MDQAYLAAVVKRVLGRKASGVQVIPLAGDASNRRYFRVVARNGSVGGEEHQDAGRRRPAGSLILMQLAEPEAFKQSEEKVTRSAIPVTELPFVNILHHLRASEVHVPQLFFYDRRAGLLLLEDLGDRLFEEAVRGAPRAVQARLYRAAIRELVQLHVVGSVKTATSRAAACIAFGRAFDLPLLMWEFDHFLEYGIEVRGGCRLSGSDRARIRARFQAIANAVSRVPRCFTHRDYHSRNLMVRRGRVWVLDFQDALMGPCQYDLASLLRDSYHTLPEDLVDELIAYYLEERPRREGQGRGQGQGMPARPPDARAFRRVFDLVSIQRNLKAAGRFVYIHAVKKNDRYLRYVPPTLAYVKRTLARHDDLAPLAALLRPHVPELN